jgi:VIT1/CCC1 family predicted Fe2+/Mn2+ transporter
LDTDRATVEGWKEHWQDELDAAYLYRVLESVETDPKRRDIFKRFAEVEDRHVNLWQEVIERNGANLPQDGRPTLRARFLGWIARRVSSDLLVSMMLREEGQEVRSYLRLHRDSPAGDAKDTALTLAQESAEHAEKLGEVAGSEGGEPWHRTQSGGFLRNVIYGFNDGLTANFGLVAGVIGATQAGQEHLILVSGIAGAAADALSMGASGYLAAKSELDVYEHEIALEKDEIELMPEVEAEELALIYETKGIGPDRARRLADEVMSSPERALEEKVREELRIGEAHATPFREGWVTGLATAVGAFIPVFPFLVFEGSLAVGLAFAIAMLSHFGVGAARSLFTGRGIFRSGFDMFVVGLGVAIVGYFVGDALVRIL